MLQKIKKSLFVLLSVVLGIFYPFISLASWVSDLANWVGTRLLFLIFKIAVDIAIWIAGLAGSLLNWVLSPNFINYSYTDPANNPVIKAGLGVTQGFVNMLLVLVLVYIAIATILRLAGYETKKLLLNFILIALLVNFSPVLTGLIVDASNIIMNFFVQDLKADAFGEAMGRAVQNIVSGFEISMDYTQAWSYVFKIAVMVPFLFGLTFVLLIFTLVFALRYMVIWLLVILSPLAFVCYILPITRKYFEQWWQQFLAWSFIGVSCGFFLYLGLLLAVNIQAGSAVTAPATGEDAPFNAVLPYFVALIFLGIGIVFGLQTSAIGATSVINFAKTKGRATVRRVGRGAKWVGGRIKERGIRPLTEKMRLKEAAGAISRGWEKAPIARWFLPEKLRLYGQMRPAITKAQERAKPYSSGMLAHRILKGADIQSDATGNLLEIIERGDAEDLFKEAKKLKKFKDKAKKMGKTELSDQDLLEDNDFRSIFERPLEMAAKGGILSSKLLRADPRLARMVAGKNWAGKTYAGMTEEEAVQEATREARRANINQMEKEVLEDETVVETMMEKGREVPEAVLSQVKKGQETMLDTIDKLFSKYIDDVLSKTNTKLAEAVRKKDPRALDESWKKYREWFKSQPQHQGREGYFNYLDGTRATEMGWREAQYKRPEPTGPMVAVVGEKPGGPPADTGEARRVKRKTPDVGKE